MLDTARNPFSKLIIAFAKLQAPRIMELLRMAKMFPLKIITAILPR
jgi:hypothetical protein